jgi:predicted acylesterase/phospholipase RssA
MSPVTDRHTVLNSEKERIRERRARAKFEPEGGPEDPCVDLVGLALSGGGIRSASFNLGVLQAFFRSGLLRFVDYLSTVSGGGYTGSFF